MDWGQNQPLSTLAEKGDLLYLCFNPVVAWKIHPRLSVGIGPTINYSQANFQRAVPSPYPGEVPNGQFKVDGDGMAYGFNAGVRWQPFDKWAFGASYRYTTTVDYHGTSSVSLPPILQASTAGSSSICFPQYVVAGVSFRPTEDWNLEFDVDWADWNKVKSIVFQGTPVGTQVLLLNYRSSFMYEFGVTRQLGQGYFASLGFFYSENSSPDANFTPAIPDSDLYLGSIGVGYHGKRWDWAVGYQFGYNPGREVKNDTSVSANGTSADGTYHFLNHAFNVAATLKF